MECREARQLAEAYVSEQLLVETMRAMVAHLERCPACRAEVEGLRRVRRATRSAFDAAVDLAPRPEFVAGLASRLQAGTVRRPVNAMPRRQWLALAASGLLAVGAGWGWRTWSASLSALMHAAVGDHQFCALTFKLAERPIPLDEAARRYGGVNASMITVAPSTDTLSGGALRIIERHSCVFDGHRFAHIVLRYKDTAVSLMVTDDPRPGAAWVPDFAMIDEHPSRLPATEGLQVASFRGPRHVVFVVSSLRDDDVQEVAQAMAGPVSRVLAEA